MKQEEHLTRNEANLLRTMSLLYGTNYVRAKEVFDLKEMLDVCKQTLINSLRTLEAKKLVERKVSVKEHPPQVYYKVTSEGVALVEELIGYAPDFSKLKDTSETRNWHYRISKGLLEAFRLPEISKKRHMPYREKAVIMKVALEKVLCGAAFDTVFTWFFILTNILGYQEHPEFKPARLSKETDLLKLALDKMKAWSYALIRALQSDRKLAIALLSNLPKVEVKVEIQPDLELLKELEKEKA